MSIMSTRDYLLICFVGLGGCVLFTYVRLYLRFRRQCRRELWAYYWDHPTACRVWTVSAFCSGVGFCVFTVLLACGVPDESALFPYSTFLFVSSCFAPLLLMIEDRKAVGDVDQPDTIPFVDDWSVRFLKCMVIFVLFRVAFSAWWLFAWSVVSLGWGGTGPVVANLCALWLALHCTVLDLMVWGWSWFHFDPSVPEVEFSWPRIDLSVAAG